MNRHRRYLAKDEDYYGHKLEEGDVIACSLSGFLRKAIIEEVKIKDKYCSLTVRPMRQDGTISDKTSKIKDANTVFFIKKWW